MYLSINTHICSQEFTCGDSSELTEGHGEACKGPSGGRSRWPSAILFSYPVLCRKEKSWLDSLPDKCSIISIWRLSSSKSSCAESSGRRWRAGRTRAVVTVQGEPWGTSSSTEEGQARAGAGPHAGSPKGSTRALLPPLTPLENVPSPQNGQVKEEWELCLERLWSNPVWESLETLASATRKLFSGDHVGGEAKTVSYLTFFWFLGFFFPLKSLEHSVVSFLCVCLVPTGSAYLLIMEMCQVFSFPEELP